MGTLAVVELPSRSGLPRDKVVNTFAFAEDVSVRGTNAQDAHYITALTNLYTQPSSLGALKIGELLSIGLSRTAGAVAIKLYDITGHLDGSPHGSPRTIGSFTLPTANATGVAVPEEVA